MGQVTQLNMMKTNDEYCSSGCSLNIVFSFVIFLNSASSAASAGIWPAIVYTHIDTEEKQSPEYL